MRILKKRHPQPIHTDSLKLLADYWTLRIVDALKESELRYCQLQRAVGNVNPVTLSNRLKKLEDARLINRREAVNKLSVMYSLSTLGREAVPVIDSINRFSHKANDVLRHLRPV